MRAVLSLCVVALMSSIATARTIVFPLVVDYPILETVLRRDLGMGDGALELWGSPGDCHWAVMDELGLGADAGRLRVIASGSAVLGFRLVWFCVSPIAWQGQLTVTTRPVVGRDWQLRFETMALDARDPDGKSGLLANGALQLARSQLEERLREFRFDLTPPADEAKALIQAAATSERARPALAALATLRPIDTAADPEGLRVRVAMDVPDADTSPPTPEAPLTPVQVAAWEDRLDRWDAFLVFAVKTLGLVIPDAGVRSELLAILLDGRRELVDVLRQGPVPGTDPIRNLFLSSWDRLRIQTRRAIHDGTLGERAYRFVTFLAAGDALAALDQAGPGLGLEISTDGLRRLARVVDPQHPGDPIAPSDAPDAELRSLFGFTDPDSEIPSPPPSSSTTVVPSTTSTLPLAWLWSPRAAEAATADLTTLGKRLDRWVPSTGELTTYRETVGLLLATLADHHTGRFDRTLAPVYRHLVPAVAWQESCWRQFVARGGTVTFLESATGDVGIMQVNRRVWRGFFDLRKLEWDVVYNAAAGAEILVQLLARFGAKEGATATDNAARAAYSAYNAGPAAFARYRSAKASASGRAIDIDFYEKYRRVAAGTAGDLVLCM